MFKTFPAAENVDLDTQEIQGDITTVELGNPDSILFGCDDHFSSGFFGLIDEIDHLLLGVAVVVGIVVGQNQLCPQFFKKSLKAPGTCDSTQCCGFDAFETFKSQVLLRIKFLKVLGFVAAFNNFRLAAVAVQKAFQMAVAACTCGFGQENVIRPFDVFDRFPQSSPGQTVAVSKRRSITTEESATILRLAE